MEQLIEIALFQLIIFHEISFILCLARFIIVKTRCHGFLESTEKYKNVEVAAGISRECIEKTIFFINFLQLQSSI